jgi:hypothetical protein
MSGPRVQSFPPNRVCAECATVLSIYNETEFCSLHGRPRKWLVNRVALVSNLCPNSRGPERTSLGHSSLNR